MYAALSFSLILSALPLFAATVRPIADVHRTARPGDRVEIQGTVTGIGGYFANLHDGTAGISVYDKVRYVFCATGDVLRISGTVGQTGGGLLHVMTGTCAKVGTDPDAARPVALTPGELANAKGLAYRAVSVRGVVADAFRDENDPSWVFLFFSPLEDRIAAAIHDPAQSLRFRTYLDAEVEVYGNYEQGTSSARPHLGPYVQTFFTNTIKVLKPANADLSSIPAFAERTASGRRTALGDGHRRRLSGTVLATYGDDAFFLKTDSDLRVRIHLVPGLPLPAPSTGVTVAGFPCPSLFFTEFVNALCRTEAAAPADSDAPVDVTPTELLFDGQNRRRLKYQMDGRLIRIRGTVIAVSTRDTGRRDLLLLCDSETVKAEIRDFPLPQLGALVEVTGICRFVGLANESLSGSRRLSGFSVLPRTPDDIRVLKEPPWWTPTRAWAAAGILLALALAALVGNLSLRKLVARKGQALAKESLARLRADLRTDERMALAVELHDTLAQNLTGVSLQLDGVDEAHRMGSPRLGPLIEKARRALGACCVELRNCLYDLRNDAFDSHDVSEAVRKAICPHLGAATADVALDLPRARLSDSTLHALLCIVRELTVNAVRHGRARHLAISGAAAANALTLSVRDDGCGFDPATRNGPDDGHFGLQGVRERLDRIGGLLDIRSSPGNGTTVTITIKP